MRKSLTFCLILFQTLLIAQPQISVKSFRKLTNDLTARIDFPLKDQNGDLCAIIKIVTDETDFKWDGDRLGIIKVEKKTGEYWLFVPWGAGRLTILHDKLGVLRDYKYPEPIEKACVYEIQLTTAKVKTVIEDQEMLTTWLTLKSSPEGADVYLNGIQKGTSNYTEKLVPGKYTYRLEKYLYHNEAGSFEITGEETNGKKLLAIDLRPEFGYLRINTLPENGAKVIVDDIETTGVTPFTSEKLKSGKHTVTVKKEMYQPKSLEVTITDNQSTIENVTLSPNFANVTIVTQPEADIYIDGRKIGTGSYTARVLAGIHTFEAKKESHYPDKKDKDVLAGHDLTVNLTLQPQLGNLEIVSTPIEATVFLNGVEKGTTPIALRKLLIGKYDLQLKKNGFSKIVKTIIIKEGQTVEINEALKDGMTKVDMVKATSSTYDTTVGDIDGNVYSTVNIGTQVWMIENLKTTKFNDGTEIDLEFDKKNWSLFDTPMYSWYNNDKTKYINDYGALYNWYTVNTNKLCPKGWHVPSSLEWDVLIRYLNGEINAGGKLKEAGTLNWNAPNEYATNQTGFTALPGGYRSYKGEFDNIRKEGFWWSTSDNSIFSAWRIKVSSDSWGINVSDSHKHYGFSVRCLRD